MVGGGKVRRSAERGEWRHGCMVGEGRFHRCKIAEFDCKEWSEEFRDTDVPLGFMGGLEKVDIFVR